MIDKKLLNNVFNQYFIDSFREKVKENDYLNNLLQRMMNDGLSEEEACDIMLYSYLNHDLGGKE